MMKNRWGAGIAITFGVFAAGILVMVAISMNREVDLVSDDYYQQELRHQNQIDSQKRSSDLREGVSIAVAPSAVIVTIPKSFDKDSTSGSLAFYRPSDRHRDFDVALRLDSANSQSVQTASLQKGLWRLKVRWTQKNNEYFHEEAIVIQ